MWWSILIYLLLCSFYLLMQLELVHHLIKSYLFFFFPTETPRWHWQPQKQHWRSDQSSGQTLTLKWALCCPGHPKQTGLLEQSLWAPDRTGSRWLPLHSESQRPASSSWGGDWQSGRLAVTISGLTPGSRLPKNGPCWSDNGTSGNT